MDKELEVLVPQSKTVTVAGEDIEIKPFKFRDFTTVSRAISNILEAMNGAEFGLATFLKAMGTCGDSVTDVLTVATRKTKSWVADLDMDAAFEIAVAVLTVNVSFFTQKVLPHVSQVSTLMGGTKKSDGTELSLGLSVEDTAIPTS
jgi:hypothetical protein